MNRLIESLRKINPKNLGYELLLWVFLIGLVLANIGIINRILPYEQVVPTAQWLTEEINENGEYGGLSNELKAQMQDDISLVTWFFFKMATLIAVSTIVAFGAISMARGRMYTISLSKGFTKKLAASLLWKNALWMMCWSILLFIGITSLKPAGFTFLFPVFLLIYLHLSAVLRYGIIQNRKLVIDLGIKKFHRFILPILACAGIILVNILISIGLLPYLFNEATRLVPSMQAVFGTLMLIGICLLAVGTITWIRQYYIETIKSIK